MWKARSFLPMLLLLASSCTLLTEPHSGGVLQVSREPKRFLLRNPGKWTVYYTAFEQTRAALVNWGPCNDPVRCRHISPNQRKVLPYDSVAGYHPGADTALIYWWYLEPDTGGTFRPDRIRVVKVRF